jgi:phosphoinositide-3-kinase regulatory subunit alpha/beta/delta
LQSIEEWTADNVVEWMAVLNLYRYAGVFKSKNIKGSDLINLDREKLLVSYFALTKTGEFF